MHSIIYFLLIAAFILFHRFWYAVFLFSLYLKMFYFVSWFLSFNCHSLVQCSASMVVCILCHFFCCWYLVFFLCGQTECRMWFQLSYVCRDLLYILICGSFWREKNLNWCKSVSNSKIFLEKFREPTHWNRIFLGKI